MSDDDEISDDLEMVAGENDDSDIKPAIRNKNSKDIISEGMYYF